MKTAKENVPGTQKRIVYSIPEMDRANVQRDLVYKSAEGTELKLDVYAPADVSKSARLPGVVFIHGGPISPQMQPKDWGAFRSWGELVAASGLVGVTHHHRYYGYAYLERAGALPPCRLAALPPCRLAASPPCRLAVSPSCRLAVSPSCASQLLPSR